MAAEKDYLGETLRLVERAREDTYFRRLDQELIAKMRQQASQAATEVETEAEAERVFTSLLIPVDFSPYSAQALRIAANIAERFASSLIVLHVISREVSRQAMEHHHALRGQVVPTSEHPEDRREEIECALVDHREQHYASLEGFLPPELARYPVELRVVIGNPFERIVETAMHDDIGLIVMGTHGRTGLSRLAAGSVAERVVRLAPCPVLTVKATIPDTESWLQEFYQTFLPAKT